MSTTIEYTDQGHGKPILFLHGFCEAKEMWQYYSDSLSPYYRILCPDLPGFGDTRWYEEEISLEQTATLLEEWISSLGLEQPVIIGHSLGGYIGLALVEQMGDKIAGLGLFHSTAFADDEEKIGLRNRTITFAHKHGARKFVDSFVPPLFTETHRESMAETIQKVVEIARKTSLEGLVAFTKAMRDRKDRMEVLKTFGGKKMMIAGQLDTAVKIEASRQHQPYLSHYYELEESGHMGMFEQPELTLAMIKEFLES
ncbi:alpha/beta hydrolase [Echinicola pacifica]|uniref:Alpha/beta hydrolase n=1 Tax=Echinicola pacifica TaxID=346377 RepID=A0A918ULI1_9BACT|nr:alpha/beta hydrolase [Echinicola pacifica]GGZ18782.1 alpha/beta hydrolase [Echinicola pacifica]